METCDSCLAPATPAERVMVDGTSILVCEECFWALYND